MDKQIDHMNTFHEIFRMVAIQQGNEGRLDRNGLKAFLEQINYQVTPEKFDEMIKKIMVGNNKFIGFEDFVKIFNIQFEDFEFKDVRNAFQFLAEDDDKYIPLEKIKKRLIKNGLSKEHVEHLTEQLLRYTDEKGVKYKDFLNSFKSLQ